MKTFISNSLARVGWVVVVAALLGSMGLVTAQPAAAEYHPRADFGSWTVADGEVFSIWRVGDRVFAGGSFSTVAPSYNDPTTSRPFLAAFDADTGDYISSFTPNLNGTVLSIHGSIDGKRLYVGGEFTSVNGLPSTAHMVALDPLTGAVDTSFVANANGAVYDIEPWDDHLYVGGKFTRIGGSFGGRLSRIDAETGDRDTSFAPRPDHYVHTIELPPSGDRLYVGGTFWSIGGVNTQPIAVLNPSNGAIISSSFVAYTSQSNSDPGRVWDIQATDDRVVVLHGGRTNPTTVNNPNGTLVRRIDSVHDFYATEAVGDRLLIAGHGYFTSPIPGASEPRDRFWALDFSTGAPDPDMEITIGAPRGLWAVHSSGSDLWLGGDLARVGGVRWGKLARLTPMASESAPTAPSGLTATRNANGSTSLSWNTSNDPDGNVVGYQVLRAGEQIAYISGRNFTDTVQWSADTDVEYIVQAIDDDNNASERSQAVLSTVSQAVDNVRPDSTVAVPAARSDVPAGVVTITGAATDDASGVDSVLVTVRNRDTLDWLQEDGTFASTFALVPAAVGTPGANSTTWSLSADLPAARFAVEPRAVDAAGNVELSRHWVPFTTIITGGPDTTDPDSQILSPAAGENVARGTVTLSGTASDNATGVSRVRVTVRNRTTRDWMQTDGSFGPDFALVDATIAGSSWSLPINVDAGNYAVTSRAIDGAGNIETDRPFVAFLAS